MACQEEISRGTWNSSNNPTGESIPLVKRLFETFTSTKLLNSLSPQGTLQQSRATPLAHKATSRSSRVTLNGDSTYKRPSGRCLFLLTQGRLHLSDASSIHQRCCLTSGVQTAQRVAAEHNAVTAATTVASHQAHCLDCGPTEFQGSGGPSVIVTM